MDYKSFKKDKKLDLIIEKLEDISRSIVNDNSTMSNNDDAQVDLKEWEYNKSLNPSGPICREIVSGAICLADREETFSLIPKQGIVAEIGVAYGDFSEKLLAGLTPKKFYAIDWFNPDNEYVSFWGDTRLADERISHINYYKRRFNMAIEHNVMEVCQGLSWDVLNQFEDNYFDYIYLDAAHDYESVKRDISVIEKKIKDGGYIQFNDYVLYSPPEGLYYGVIPAVNEWLNKSKTHRVIARCFHQRGYDDLLVQIHK